jgi:hypothetical protein
MMDVRRRSSDSGDRMTGARNEREFDELARRPYADVLIIGGGINGLADLPDWRCRESMSPSSSAMTS